ncbi:hypothetical protein BG07_3862 [Bacillus pseudomycoides]|nr:hypothetical protein DJ92_1074 [Bacillus pseudomycoides]AJI19479.1 hypothetical protein BG07_3862 [Bacillus pseudomycoides]
MGRVHTNLEIKILLKEMELYVLVYFLCDKCVKSM